MCLEKIFAIHSDFSGELSKSWTLYCNKIEHIFCLVTGKDGYPEESRGRVSGQG